MTPEQRERAERNRAAARAKLAAKKRPAPVTPEKQQSSKRRAGLSFFDSDPDATLPESILVNRSPCLTLWVAVCARYAHDLS